MSYSSVSVIIPAFNVASCLSHSIESALDQTARPFEVIVINDGSTDDTEGVARQYGNRIRYLKQANQGQGSARNVGIQVALGEYIAFLDADDYWLPTFLESCMTFLHSHPIAVAVSSGSIIKKWGHPDHIWTGPPGQHWEKEKPRVLEKFFQFWGDHDHVRTGTVMIRRSVIEKAGCQRGDLRVSQDLEYWAYIATFGPWGLISTPLWVGNPMSSIVDRTWLQKYRRRRCSCPSVEQWERRIVPRLRDEEWPGFRRVRGRVAAGYCQNRILNGDTTSARQVVRCYGSEMPVSSFSKTVRCADRLGGVGWGVACKLVVFRERLKSLLVDLHLRWNHHGSKRSKAQGIVDTEHCFPAR